MICETATTQAVKLISWRNYIMKYAKCLVALMALCIFVIPAFSMPDNGNYASDGNHQMSDDHQARDNQRHFIKTAGQDDQQQPCQCQASNGEKDQKNCQCNGQDGRQGCECQKPMMGENACGKDGNRFIKPMMCSKGQNCMQGSECQRPMMGGNACGQDDHKSIKSMMGEGRQGHNFQESGMCKNSCGQEGNKFIKSLMGKNACGMKGHKLIKSMMGGKINHGNTEIKTVIINVNI